MKKEKKLFKNCKGFTLIELLVVVLIIGILAAIALPKYNRAVYKSRFLQAKVLAKKIADAEERFYTVNNSYTKDLEKLDIDIMATNETLDADGGRYYFYDWGQCHVPNGERTRADMTCTINRNEKAFVKYFIGLSNSDYYTNQRMCIAYGDDKKPVASDFNYKLCQEETKDPYPDSFGSTSIAWEYK